MLHFKYKVIKNINEELVNMTHADLTVLQNVDLAITEPDTDKNLNLLMARTSSFTRRTLTVRVCP